MSMLDAINLEHSGLKVRVPLPAPIYLTIENTLIYMDFLKVGNPYTMHHCCTIYVTLFRLWTGVHKWCEWIDANSMKFQSPLVLDSESCHAR